eukprot:4411846-Alexandrium_andersonii.AAC.1
MPQGLPRPEVPAPPGDSSGDEPTDAEATPAASNAAEATLAASSPQHGHAGGPAPKQSGRAGDRSRGPRE